VSGDSTSKGNSIILDEEFVAFKVNPNIYSAFYLGYLLGRVNADVQYNYSTFAQESINFHAKRSHDIIQHIDETWEVDHLQNIASMRHGYSATIRYQGLTLYCSSIDVSSINRILAAINDVRTIYQLRTVFTTNGYVMVKMSYNNYIVMSDTAYHQHLIDIVTKP
jgi:hypothetical protein